MSELSDSLYTECGFECRKFCLHVDHGMHFQTPYSRIMKSINISMNLATKPYYKKELKEKWI